MTTSTCSNNDTERHGRGRRGVIRPHYRRGRRGVTRPPLQSIRRQHTPRFSSAAIPHLFEPVYSPSESVLRFCTGGGCSSSSNCISAVVNEAAVRSRTTGLGYETLFTRTPSRVLTAVGLTRSKAVSVALTWSDSVRVMRLVTQER